MKEKLYGTYQDRAFVADTGEILSVPDNYSSKSLLVEGDRLACYFTEEGPKFKNFQPIPRIHIEAQLVEENDLVMAERLIYGILTGQRYKILDASITFFKVHVGDTVLMAVPKESQFKSPYGAILGKL